MLCGRIGQRFGIVQSLFEITKSLGDILPAELENIEGLGRILGGACLHKDIPAIFKDGYM